MKIYKSYEEAKINHKNEVIWTDHNKNFGCASAFKNSGYTVFKTEPEEYCMSIEEFLNAGLKFKVGDLYLTSYGRVEDVHNEDFANTMNSEDTDGRDRERYVLRASALEKPKRTRTEYEKVTESIFDLRDEFERGELYADDKGIVRIQGFAHLGGSCQVGTIYRKVEKEIDWRDEVCDHFGDCQWFDGGTSIGNAIMSEHASGEFLELCRVALRANGEIE